MEDGLPRVSIVVLFLVNQFYDPIIEILLSPNKELQWRLQVGFGFRGARACACALVLT